MFIDEIKLFIDMIIVLVIFSVVFIFFIILFILLKGEGESYAKREVNLKAKRDSAYVGKNFFLL